MYATFDCFSSLVIYRLAFSQFFCMAFILDDQYCFLLNSFSPLTNFIFFSPNDLFIFRIDFLLVEYTQGMTNGKLWINVYTLTAFESLLLRKGILFTPLLCLLLNCQFCFCTSMLFTISWAELSRLSHHNFVRFVPIEVCNSHAYSVKLLVMFAEGCKTSDANFCFQIFPIRSLKINNNNKKTKTFKAKHWTRIFFALIGFTFLKIA